MDASVNLENEIDVDKPIPVIVGACQTAPSHFAQTDDHVVQFASVRSKAGLDILETFSVGQLSEGHAKKLIHAPEPLGVPVALVIFYLPPEGVER